MSIFYKIAANYIVLGLMLFGAAIYLTVQDRKEAKK